MMMMVRRAKPPLEISLSRARVARADTIKKGGKIDTSVAKYGQFGWLPSKVNSFKKNSVCCILIQWRGNRHWGRKEKMEAVSEGRTWHKVSLWTDATTASSVSHTNGFVRKTSGSLPCFGVERGRGPKWRLVNHGHVSATGTQAFFD